MMVVRSPRLKRCMGVLVSTARGEDWVCYDPLNKLIEIPDAKFYWLEASTSQWKDKSGKRVFCRIHLGWEGNYAEYLYEGVYGLDWNELYMPTVRPLKQLGLHSSGKPKAIYIRLLYQE